MNIPKIPFISVQTILLLHKKIEELMLYAIEQDKKIESQQKEIGKLKKSINQ